MVDHGALVTLLVDKGVITDEEYLEAIAEGMEREARDYKEMLSNLLGVRVTLA